jgi:hypothetical protein
MYERAFVGAKKDEDRMSQKTGKREAIRSGSAFSPQQA